MISLFRARTFGPRPICLFCRFRRTGQQDPESVPFSLERKLLPDGQKTKLKLQLEPEESVDSRFLRVAILGMPNSGKSELTNKLVGSPISTVSSKINTTRLLTVGVAVDGNTQLMLLDTPGVILPYEAKKLGALSDSDSDSLIGGPETSVSQAQLILVLMDADNEFQCLEVPYKIHYLLNKYRLTPSILVLNKIDLVKKSILPNYTHNLSAGRVGGVVIERKEPILAASEKERMATLLKDYTAKKFGSTPVTLRESASDEKDTVKNKIKNFDAPLKQVQQSRLRSYFKHSPGWPNFDAVFYISALTGDGVDDLKDYLLKRSLKGKWRYHSSVTTSKAPEDVVKDVIRGKLYDELPGEIPYQLKLQLLVFEEDEHGVLRIRYDIVCAKPRWTRTIVGKKGERIQRIASECLQTLRNLFQQDVYFKLGVVTESTKNNSLWGQNIPKPKSVAVKVKE